MSRNRLPNEIKSSDVMAGRNRLLQQEVVHNIADKISQSIGRPLDQLELSGLISHIRRLDANRFRTMPIDEATTQIADTYLKYKEQRADVIYDTHEIMKQYIGGDVQVSPDRFIIKKNCGTSNGQTPDLPSVAHQGGHTSAYAMFPNLEGIAGRVVLPTVSPSPAAPNTIRTLNGPELSIVNPDGPRTIEEEEYLLTRSGKDSDIAGVPIQGIYIKKNNIIKSREKVIQVILDSRYRVRSTDPSTFTWTLTSQPTDAPGSVSAQAGMGNIVYMQFDEFYIPYVASADNTYKKITLLIEELGMTSVMGHENRHYHMIFDTTVVTNRILLTPPDNDKFRFNEPIDQVKRITITFAAPLTPVTFLQDVFPITVSSFAVGITYLTFAVRHFVSDGEVVIISGFTTANPQVDFAAIANVNALAGNTVAVIDDFTLEITVDTSTVTFLATPPSVECYITTRRIFMPLKFVYVV